MSDLKEFRLPDVGEGLTEADIVTWHVKPGDTIKDGQIIVEIETAKAVVELPTPFSGTVTRLLVDEGQTVEVGVPIIAVDTSGGAAPATPAAGQAAPAEAAPAAAAEPDANGAGEGRQPVLVGYGVRTAPPTPRPRKPPAGQAAADVGLAQASADAAPPASPENRALAKPPVRK